MSNPYDVLSQLTPEQAAAWQAQFGSPPAQAPQAPPPPPQQAGPPPADVADLQNYANKMAMMPTAKPFTPPQAQPSPADIADLQKAAGYYQQLPNAVSPKDIADLQGTAAALQQPSPIVDNDKPPPKGYEKSGGQWEMDDDGVQRYYVPAPVAKSQAQSPYKGAAYVGEPSKDADYERSQPKKKQKDEVEIPFATPNENMVRNVYSKLLGSEHGAVKQSFGDSVHRSILQEAYTNALAEAKQKDLDEYQQQRKEQAIRLGNSAYKDYDQSDPVQDEVVHPLPGGGYRLEDRRDPNMQMAPYHPPPTPAHVRGEGPVAMGAPIQHAMLAANVPTEPDDAPVDPRAEYTRQRAIDLQRQMLDKQTQEQAARQAASAQGVSPTGVVDTLKHTAQVLRDIPGQAADATRYMIGHPSDIPELYKEGKKAVGMGPAAPKPVAGADATNSGGGEPEGGAEGGPTGYTPMTVIPGGRTPAMWQIREGMPVSEEDQGRIAEARAAQQAGIANIADADVGTAQARAADLATQQKALSDLNTMQNARIQNLLNQKQQQITKMQGIVDQIRNRQIDDKDVFLLPGAAGKFFSAIGVALGAGVQARLGLHQNPSLEVVKGRIDQIVQEQRAKMEQDKHSLGAQESLLGQMQSQFGDQQTADQAAKIALLERAKLHTDEIAQTSTVPRIKANAQALSADLGMQGAKEQMTFNQMAQDHVMRRDVMTKPQVFGGAPIGGGSAQGAEVENERQIVIPEDLTTGLVSDPANARWIATDAKSTEALRKTVEAAATIHNAYLKVKQLEEQNPHTIYDKDSAAGNQAMEEIGGALGKVGALQGNSRLPIIDVDIWKERLAPHGLIANLRASTGLGATLTDRLRAMDAIARREMITTVRTHAAEQGRRHLTVTPQGVRPGVHYTGESADKPAVPRGAKPVPGMPYQDPGRSLQYKPEVRVGTPAQGKGKNRKPATETVVSPEEDEGDDE